MGRKRERERENEGQNDPLLAINVVRVCWLVGWVSFALDLAGRKHSFFRGVCVRERERVRAQRTEGESERKKEEFFFLFLGP